MQFFNYFRISLGLLNLSVFSFYCIIFSLFFFFLYSRHPRFSAAGDCGFLVYCVILYINIYTKKYLSQHSSANLQVIVQLVYLVFYQAVYQGSLSRQSIKHSIITLACCFQVRYQHFFSGIFSEFTWKQFYSENKRLSLILHIGLQDLWINVL